MFTKTTLFHKPGEGGGSSGDQHNLGWYATQSALETAHATATAGDWAIVGSTDTVWIWDTDTNAWKDSDQKGQVTSVNGQTGDVTVGGLPDQTGQSGKFLTTDGSSASWSNKPLVNKASASVQNQSLSLIGDGTSVAGAINIGLWSSANYTQGIAIGQNAQSTSKKSTTIGGIAIGSGSKARQLQVSIGHNTQGSQAETTGICLGNGAQTGAEAAMQICFGSRTASNTDANTLKIANNIDNYEFMSADGTIPEARLADTTNAAQGDVLTLDANLNAVWAAGGSGGGISDVTVNGTSVVSGGVAAITCATIDDTSTSSLTATWSASKLNTTIGDIETLINAL